MSAEVSYKKLGCYKDNRQQERPLSELLFTDRDETSPKYSGRKYTKENFNRRYLGDLVGRCASECKKLGYQVFGIEKFGIMLSLCDQLELYCAYIIANRSP